MGNNNSSCKCYSTNKKFCNYCSSKFCNSCKSFKHGNKKKKHQHFCSCQSSTNSLEIKFEDCKIHICRCQHCHENYNKQFFDRFDRLCSKCIIKYSYRKCQYCNQPYRRGKLIYTDVGSNDYYCSDCRFNKVCKKHLGCSLKYCYLCEQEEDEKKERIGSDYNYNF